ncbi:MAG: hypothetical protein CVU73_14545 [Deltaproteobacteria bacterium HGW-Deltaproteobacteria-8]|jgi:hypothetical protein|nr:MAG: hypothetical protein CVU73_14545 [Deltaproteobacteria bacterium HGW-Deltaproteobacteria-8]
MNRALLEKPFLAAEIRHREGGNGKILDYVEGHVVVARLNDAFDGNWDFIVKSFDVNEARGEVLVVGRLTAEGITKMQFGSSSITRHKTTKEPVSIADDLKAAATDALKKCATLFGVALSLHGGKHEARTQPAPSAEPLPAATPTPTAHAPGRLSSKQHSYLLTLSRGHGLTRREVDALCIERFGVVLDHVTRSEASLLIEEFNNPEPQSQTQQQPERRTVGGVH